MAEEKQKKHFFGDIKKELKKVIWPTKAQTAKNTLSVIVIVFLVSFIVIVFDFLLVKANDFVIDKSTGGKVTEYRTSIEKKNQILEEMKQYTDEDTLRTYSQMAYYMDVESLQQVLDEMKNPQEPEEGTNENNENNENTENNGNTENGENGTNNTTQE